MNMNMKLLTNDKDVKISNQFMVDHLTSMNETAVVPEFDPEYPMAICINVVDDTDAVFLLFGHPEKPQVIFGTPKRGSDFVFENYQYFRKLYDIDVAYGERLLRTTADSESTVYGTAMEAAAKLGDRDRFPVSLLPEEFTFDKETHFFIEETVLGHHYHLILDTATEHLYLDKTATWFPENFSELNLLVDTRMRMLDPGMTDLPANLAEYF